MAKLICKTKVEAFSCSNINFLFDNFSEDGNFLFFKLTNLEFQEILKIHKDEWSYLLKQIKNEKKKKL